MRRIVDGLRRAAQGLMLHLHGRFRQLADELTEEEKRFSRALGWQLLALFLSCLSLALLLVLTVVIFWDTPHRIGVIVGLTLAVALMAAAAWWWHRHFMRSRPEAFEKSVGQLREDAAAMAPPPPPPLAVPEPGAASLRQEHLYLLLPVAVLAALNFQTTVRLGLSALALLRGIEQELRQPPGPR